MVNIMIKHRLHHWSCSKLADIIRGEKKPYALELEQWAKWRDEQNKKRPFRYWLSDTVLIKLQDIFYFPYDIYSTVRDYICNRFIDKLQYLETGLQPGQYYDLDTRIMHGLFNELTKFVEIELAHTSLWNKDKHYNFKNGRCIEAAYDYFNWASNLRGDDGELTEQAKSAIKIQILYEWWKNHRKQELYQEKEDTEMLIELIKIRHHLWT